MIVHQEITLTGLQKTNVFNILESFCQQNGAWRWEKSNKSPGFSSYNMTPKGEVKYCWALQSNNTAHLSTIVPAANELSISEYNAFADIFIQAFDAWAKQEDVEVAIDIQERVLGTSELISSEVPRRDFLSFVDDYNGHPQDNQRVDRFIVNVHRFSPRQVKWDLLRRHLIEDFSWDADVARGLIKRCEDGSELLELYDSITLG